MSDLSADSEQDGQQKQYQEKDEKAREEIKRANQEIEI